jgi:acyl-coenzyme A synthetase/AMP-(fatty) acid ligase
VVGRPGPDGDEEVIAFVEARGEGGGSGAGDAAALAGELSAGLRGQLAPYKLPARIVVVPALPAGATGKVLKAALRDMALALA